MPDRRPPGGCPAAAYCAGPAPAGAVPAQDRGLVTSPGVAVPDEARGVAAARCGPWAAAARVEAATGAEPAATVAAATVAAATVAAATVAAATGGAGARSGADAGAAVGDLTAPAAAAGAAGLAGDSGAGLPADPAVARVSAAEMAGAAVVGPGAGTAAAVVGPTRAAARTSAGLWSASGAGMAVDPARRARKRPRAETGAGSGAGSGAGAGGVRPARRSAAAISSAVNSSGACVRVVHHGAGARSAFSERMPRLDPSDPSGLTPLGTFRGAGTSAGDRGSNAGASAADPDVAEVDELEADGLPAGVSSQPGAAIGAPVSGAAASEGTSAADLRPEDAAAPAAARAGLAGVTTNSAAVVVGTDPVALAEPVGPRDPRAEDSGTDDSGTDDSGTGPAGVTAGAAATAAAAARAAALLASLGSAWEVGFSPQRKTPVWFVGGAGSGGTMREVLGHRGDWGGEYSSGRAGRAPSPS